ncbi:MAG TPA: hypothetical protein PK760_07165, partial [Flavobacteriales bacterium]|nr:hypothetical protein [Flavobacteriales bacterium]
MRGTILILALLAAGISVGQDATISDKGTFFVYWGYNRAMYTTSDIHLNGDDYNFILRDVVAKDRQSKLDWVYVKPTTIWIPQYNYRFGWFFNDRWSISVGLDHMKYVVVQDQVVRMDGYINGSRSTNYNAPEGERNEKLTKDFLMYEHTDGLNLVSFDLDHYDPLWSSKNGRFRLRAFEGVHAGPVIPRTDVRLFGVGINNRWN